MVSRYAVGIDLGTTNCVAAFKPLSDEAGEPELLPIPQVIAPSTVQSSYTLPSFCYLAAGEERDRGAFDLPWEKGLSFCVGEGARARAADLPGRTVSAAKSWLVLQRADRRGPILPWDAPAEVERISPVEASRRYLAHIAAAWNAKFSGDPLAEQKVVLTVPASFDASAKELTFEAARTAGFPEDLVLLEEPQASVYAWIAEAKEAWRNRTAKGDVLLVCDVGGGTSDFSLVGVDEEGGELALRRLAVGNHILVGGDNMDLALAHLAREAFGRKGIDLDPWQSVALWHACRAAKEKLLSGEGPAGLPVTLLGRGSRLVGGTVSVDLDREEVLKTLLEGFFPRCDLDARPARRLASGFRQIGLPFEADTGITRHLAAFLAAHGARGDGGEVRPTHLLFNGGVFKSEPFRDRVREVAAGWFGDRGELQVLDRTPELDFAVARGAAHYAFVKERGGVRIRGGTARAYYVGIETAGPAVPGRQRPLSALCVVPFGMEEGTEIEVPSEEIGLVVGEEAAFRFFSSPARKEDRAGDLLSSNETAGLSETDPLTARLAADERFEEGTVPVRFLSRITELGVFELWCRSTVSQDRWKLEFSVREGRDP